MSRVHSTMVLTVRHRTTRGETERAHTVETFPGHTATGAGTRTHVRHRMTHPVEDTRSARTLHHAVVTHAVVTHAVMIHVATHVVATHAAMTHVAMTHAAMTHVVTHVAIPAM
jgi:hypothetical protein